MKLKKLFKIYSISFLLGILGSACTSESPFYSEGEGTVRLNVSVNSKITRAEVTGDERDRLLNECVIYISDGYGLLHKWKGVYTVPEQLTMKYGTYLAEAWSGDSVTASLTSKFYKGQTQFELNDNSQTAQVTIECKIANVVGSIDKESIDENLMKNLSVTFGNSRGEVEMTGDDLFGKAYLMMPDEDNTLLYKVSCESIDGISVIKEDKVENVISGHEYRLKFKTKESESTNGGTFFDIEVVEYNDEIENDFVIYGAPDFSWTNPALTAGGQIVKGESFNTEVLRIAAFKGFKSLKLSTGNVQNQFSGMSAEYEFVKHENLNVMNQFGINVETSDTPKSDNLFVWNITFDKINFFDKLPDSDTEYKMTITAEDKSGKSTSMDIRIANTEAAIVYEAPIIVPDIKFYESDYTAVTTSSATIPVRIINSEVFTALQYRKADSSEEWKEITVTGTKASNDEIRYIILSNLEANTTYEYRVVGGDFVDGHYKSESEPNRFTTEEKFIIPNAGLEDWYQKDSKIWIPMADSSKKFWDSGNHGGAQYSASLGNITTKSTSLFHNGSASARLKSNYIVIKFAAGNLFAGEFGTTVGTNGAKLTFGQPFNGSHPKALKLYANYRPASVDRLNESDATKELIKGQLDHGQIFVAIASAPSELNTAEGKMFDSNASNILGFGEVTWKDKFGEDDQLDEIEIPIVYNDRVKTNKATHIIIVCSSSKYGDYFSGGSGSTMYVDDFELVY